MKATRKPRSKFERWVLGPAGGSKKLSEALGVTQDAVNHWCAGRATPNLAIAEKILKISGGKVTIADLLNAKKPCA